MTNNKKTSFNREFVFESDGLSNDQRNDPDSEKKINKKKRKLNDDNSNGSLSDENENNDNDASKKELEKLIKKQDHVRIKTKSTKKQKLEQEQFFEIQSKDERDKNAKTNNFGDMNISKPLIKALGLMGLNNPTPIQAAAIPTALMGRDICACAVTGSGKTLAFMLPTLERLLYKPKFPQVTRVLVLTPTRELAVQICKVTRELAQFTNINICLCAGGFDIKSQEAALRMGPDVCIATPGRLIDHLHNTPSFNLETVEILILDEADRMLDEYFAEQLKEVMRLCSKNHQTMLFSATMTDTVEDLVKMSLKRPVKIFINENQDVTPLLKQEFVRIRDESERNKESILAALIQRKFNDRVIVFVKTKSDCHKISLLLELLGLKAAELHGGLTQTQRLEKLNAFKDNSLNILVATDLAARGLDIANVKTVINFSMPMTFKHYIHRVGRTARAQNSGRAISLVGEADRWLVKEIVKSSKEAVKCRIIPADVMNIYREKVDNLRQQLISKLREENDAKLIDKMEKDISRAQERIKKTSKSDRKNSKKMEATKRTWLKNVDYRNGGLLSDKKTKKKSNVEKDSENQEKEDKPKKKKFLTKFHKEEHDNIFSKKFKQNELKLVKKVKRK